MDSSPVCTSNWNFEQVCSFFERRSLVPLRSAFRTSSDNSTTSGESAAEPQFGSHGSFVAALEARKFFSVSFYWNETVLLISVNCSISPDSNFLRASVANEWSKLSIEAPKLAVKCSLLAAFLLGALLCYCLCFNSSEKKPIAIPQTTFQKDSIHFHHLSRHIIVPTAFFNFDIPILLEFDQLLHKKFGRVAFD